MDCHEILSFWFEDIDSKKWWVKDADFDQHLRDRFGDTHARAAACELYTWRTTPEGRLAEIIVLDQFSRNMFRDTPQAFAYDALALALAQEAVAVGDDQPLPPRQRSFLYMPYMHSESLIIHDEAVRLFSQEGLEFNLDFEIKHKVILEEFGRYPHRNHILGRENTPEESHYLAKPGAGF